MVRNVLLKLNFLSVERGVIAGWPSYITQEEFNRYNGFWWCPVKSNSGADYILYEEVDAVIE